MPDTPGTFSEHWYRLCGQRISLRPHAQIHRQYYRGKRWHVIRDPFSNRFYRMRPAAYDFVARLRRDRSVEEAWRQCIDANPDDAPGQEEVVRLLSQLYQANLLQYERPGDSVQLFERYRKVRERETRHRLLNIMFARFPLFDPDDIIDRLMPVARAIISPFGALVWLVLVGYAIKLAADNAGALVEQAGGILAPQNLPLLYLGLVLIKTAHEFGHSFVCKRFGGEVHTMGIMLLVFTPLPYMDASSSWAFRERWKRVLTGAAGILVELFIAACAMLVWANTSPGTPHRLMYNMMFIASVSTVLFNANPLLRFDGYYILSDLLDIPNLHSQSAKQLVHLVERYAFGYRKSESPAETVQEKTLLTTFGILSWAYRVVVFTGIILFVADRFLLAGIIMFVICVVSWVLTPLLKFLHYLTTSARLERNRPRAMLVSVAFLVAVLGLFGWVQWPEAFRAPGVVQAGRVSQVITGTPGYLGTLHLASGDRVSEGEPVVTLRNEELDYQVDAAAAKLRLARAQLDVAMSSSPPDMAPLRERLETLRKHLRHLRERRAALVVRAAHDGRLLAPDLADLEGVWIRRGVGLGRILEEKPQRFLAVVTQREASRLFPNVIRDASVRLRGQADHVVPVTSRKILASEERRLPSPALGWMAGGSITTDVRDPQGVKTTEPFFLVQAELGAVPAVALLHGRSGMIRFELAPRPLLQQWWRRFRQLLQERYQL